ncbi:MAG: FAD-binding oxidoreductase [Mesorhizobium sp.]
MTGSVRFERAPHAILARRSQLLAQLPSFAPDASQHDMNNEYDIIIIGSGIAGVGLAAALGEGRKVLILEQESRPAFHSTGRSAAIFIQNYGNAAIRALSSASAAMFHDPDPTLFPYPLLSQRGMMYVADEDGLEHHRHHLDAAQGMVSITPDEAIAKVPALRREKLAAAAFEADAQDVDVAALHEGWLRRTRALGAVLKTDAQVVSAERVGDRWRVEAAGGPFHAPIVVNAAGAWADDLARRCGVATLGLTPMRRSIAVLPAPEHYDPTRWPLVADSAEGWYLKPDAGKLYVSPAEEIPVEPHDAFVDDMILAEGLWRFEQAIDFPVTRVERSWAGLRTFAPDRTPVAGFDPKAEGFFWLAGQGGYGIQTSPALSALSAALVKGERPPAGLEAVAETLSPGRFST